jgi:hypothetical protein
MILAALTSIVFRAAPPAPQEWVQLDGPIRQGPQGAYDAARGRLVVQGQEGETWEFEDNLRLHRESLSSAKPAVRLRAAMAADPLHGITLLFGGNKTGTGFAPHLADTWLWDGSRWQEVAGPGPSARIDASLCYDRTRGRFVLFGGQADAGLVFDTWEFDGSAWSEITTANRPSQPRGPMVYDTTRGVCVLVSSPGLLGAPMLVHEYDGVDWTARPASGSWPLARSNFALAHDESRGVTVMLGGTSEGEEIWEWDGALWRLASTAGEPRVDPYGYYDPTLAAVVVVGGVTMAPLPVFTYTDAHTWDGTTFAQLRPGHSPAVRFDHVFFADPVRGELVLALGSLGLILNDSWSWDGLRWSELHPATLPTARTNTASTVDTTRNVALVFGGFLAGGFLGDLWAWDGQTWSQVPTAGGPSARAGAGMSFDAQRGVVVLFGGSNKPIFLANSTLSDTWEWDGAGWTQRASPIQPSPREQAALAHDAARGVTVLFGGRTGATAQSQIDDTWEWNGSAWTELHPAQTPGALLNPSLVYDPDRGRVVLLGYNATTVQLELWQLDPGTWTPIDLDGEVIGSGNDMVWDPARRRLTVYDGVTVRAWTSTPAGAGTYGASCGRAPLPMVRTRARIGEPLFGIEARVPPGQLAVFAIGLAPASLAFRDCTLLVTPLLTRLALGDQFGTASVKFPLVNDISYAGLPFYAQVAVPMPGAALNASEGLRIVLGD